MHTSCFRAPTPAKMRGELQHSKLWKSTIDSEGALFKFEWFRAKSLHISSPCSKDG